MENQAQVSFDIILSHAMHVILGLSSHFSYLKREAFLLAFREVHHSNILLTITTKLKPKFSKFDLDTRLAWRRNFATSTSFY